jgi:hypothetical protein
MQAFPSSVFHSPPRARRWFVVADCAAGECRLQGPETSVGGFWKAKQVDDIEAQRKPDQLDIRGSPSFRLICVTPTQMRTSASYVSVMTPLMPLQELRGLFFAELFEQGLLRSARA